MPLLGALPVGAPYRGFAYHQFTGGYDLVCNVQINIPRGNVRVLSDIKLFIGHYAVYVKGKSKQIFASVIKRNDHFTVVVAYQLDASRKRVHFVSFNIEFYQKLLVFVFTYRVGPCDLNVCKL